MRYAGLTDEPKRRKGERGGRRNPPNSVAGKRPTSNSQHPTGNSEIKLDRVGETETIAEAIEKHGGWSIE